jgi:hypothetical protein
MPEMARIEKEVKLIHERIDEILERLREQQEFDKALAERRFPGAGETQPGPGGRIGGCQGGVGATHAPMGSRH